MSSTNGINGDFSGVLKRESHHREQLRSAGIRSYGAVSSGGIPPWQVDHSVPGAFLLGSEAFGLAPELASQLDATVTIPMPSLVDSYSVNAAAAILLYEAGRPRERS